MSEVQIETAGIGDAILDRDGFVLGRFVALRESNYHHDPDRILSCSLCDHEVVSRPWHSLFGSLSYHHGAKHKAARTARRESLIVEIRRAVEHCFPDRADALMRALEGRLR